MRTGARVAFTIQYSIVAIGLGVAWGLLLFGWSPHYDGLLPAPLPIGRVPFVVMAVTSLGLAWLLFPWFLASRGWLLVANAVWMTAAGACVSAWILIAILEWNDGGSTAISIEGFAIGAPLFALLIAVNAWYAVVPMGIVSVFLLRQVAVRQRMVPLPRFLSRLSFR